MIVEEEDEVQMTWTPWEAEEAEEAELADDEWSFDESSITSTQLE